jgi:hypothetical protein
MPSRLVQIPKHLLHVGLDDLPQLGVPTQARDLLRALLADLPLVPDASSSAQLAGPPGITLPCLAVLARHVGQGLRDQNLSIAHDRTRLAVQRAKLVFLSADALADAIALGDERPAHEAVLFVVEATAALQPLIARRDAAGLATYVTAQSPMPELAHWRRVDLTP